MAGRPPELSGERSSGAGIFISRRTMPSALPCVSSRSERLAPPARAWSITKLNAMKAGELIAPDLTDSHRPQEFGDGRLGQMGLEPGVAGRIVGHDADIGSISLVAAPGVRQVAQPNPSRQFRHCRFSSTHDIKDGSRFAAALGRRSAHSAAVRTSTRVRVFGQVARHQGRPVAERRARRWPAGGITGDARRSRGDQRGQLAAKPLDGRAVRVADRHAQHHLERRRRRTNDARRDVAGSEALDQGIGQLNARPAHPLEDDRPGRARLGLGVAPHHGQHAAGRPAVAIDGHQLESIRRRMPGRSRDRHAIPPLLRDRHRREIDVDVGCTIPRGVVDLVEQLFGDRPDVDPSAGPRRAW